jgi:hypothetical protein
MSLILTHISSHGIIHASDGNLTSSNGSSAGEAPKVFEIPFLNAGLSIAGAYNVAGQRMDEWLIQFIKHQQDSNCSTLKDFATALSQSFETEMLPVEKDGGSLVHLAGYVHENNEWHPEFWFVRNIYQMDSITGEYKDFRETFQVSEDLWTRDWHQNNLSHIFPQGGYQLYINGFTSGRVSYMILQQKMNQFFTQIWQNNTWKFRPPNSLEESKLIVDLFIRVIGVLFQLSNYSAPFIGGVPQCYGILNPQ